MAARVWGSGQHASPDGPGTAVKEMRFLGLSVNAAPDPTSDATVKTEEIDSVCHSPSQDTASSRACGKLKRSFPEVVAKGGERRVVDACDCCAGRKAERRVANDGYAYTREEFEAWGLQRGSWAWDASWAWQRASVVVPAAGPPGGLTLAHVREALVLGALEELRPLLLRDDWQPGQNVCEAGFSFFYCEYNEAGSETKATTVEATSLGSLPRLHALLRETMQLLNNERELEPRLNVICRLYLPGVGIVMHSDRKDWFEEDVYGCILENTADRTLEFHSSDEISEYYMIDERPGTCFHQRGEARYAWRHGVAPLARGERISVTWRWFLPDVTCVMRTP